MKVLIQAPEDPRFRTVVLGWVRVLQAAGYPCRVWPAGQPAFDAFADGEPDVLIRTSRPTRAVAKCLASRPRLRVVDQEVPAFGFDHLGLLPGRFDPGMACDLAFVGTYRPDKAELLDAYLRPLVESGEFRVKLFGAGEWPGYAHHLGVIDESMIPDLHASARATLDVTLTHRSERMFRSMGLGRHGVTTRPYADVRRSPEEFLAAARRFLLEEEPETEAHHRRRRDIILLNHTYAHRVAAMLRTVGLEDEARHVLTKLARNPDEEDA